MRKRNIRIQCWLNKKEAEAFNKMVKRSGISKEAYLRHLINGLVPNDAPPPDYFTMIRELQGIGSRINQIAIKAHTFNSIDAKRYDENYRALVKALEKISDAVILPRSMNNGDHKYLEG